jgi:hypothetical protein
MTRMQETVENKIKNRTLVYLDLGLVHPVALVYNEK